MGQVFISYSNRDRERVAEMVSALKGEGYQVWWDADLTPGGDWDLEIQQALEQCRTVLVVWSENAMQSREVRAEATYALNENKLLPVRIEPVKIWARYNIVQYEDVLDRPLHRDPNWPAVMLHLRSRIGHAPAVLVTAPPIAANDHGTAPQAVPAAPLIELDDRPVLPLSIAAPALLMSASGLSLIGSLVLPFTSLPDSDYPLYAAIAFGALAAGIVLASFVRPQRST